MTFLDLDLSKVAGVDLERLDADLPEDFGETTFWVEDKTEINQSSSTRSFCIGFKIDRRLDKPK